MKPRIKKITIPKMGAKAFEALLLDLGSCSAARMWAKGKTLQRVWGTCKIGDWMEWLLLETAQASRDGWPDMASTQAVRDEANSVFFRTPANEHEKAMADVFRKYVSVK